MSVFSSHSLDSALLLHYVLEPAARSLALAGVVWLLLAAFRVRDVTFRLAAWTAVLYAALAMPFLGQVLPEIPVLLPVKQAAPAAVIQPAVTTREATFVTSDSAPLSEVAVSRVAPDVAEAAPVREIPSVVQPAASSDGRATTISWPAVAAGLYCALVGIFLGRLTLGIILSKRLRRSSQPVIVDARLKALLARETWKAGLRGKPQIAESSAITIPATLGVRRPVILFPPAWREWSETQMSAVLAHELSHIARHDALTQTLSRVYRAFFWFSPLSWLLDRAVVDLAEQASDDAALRAGTDRTRYAEVLLDFFRTLKTSKRRVRWQAVSMAQGARSARRLERILSEARLSRRLGQTAFAAVVLTVAPLVCLAATVQPSLSARAQAIEPPAAPAPPPPPAMASMPVILERQTKLPPATPLAPTKSRTEPKALKAAPAPVVALLLTRLEVPSPVFLLAPPARLEPPRLSWFFARAPQSADKAGTAARVETERWFSNSDCRGNEAFAIVSGNKMTTQCGSPADMEHVQELRRHISGSFLWFRKNGRSYIIRDPATVKAALDAFAAQKALARQQAELGRQQGRLGSRQAALGMRQSEVHVTVPDLSAEMRQMESTTRKLNFSATQAQMEQAQARLAAALKSLDSSATQEQLGRAQAQLAATLQALNSSAEQQALRQVQVEMAQMQSRLGSLQAMAGEKQAAIGRQQAELGKQQEALGRRQAELGRKQAELARKAAQQVHRLIDQAIAHGLAKPE